jgi:hypothetical protein
MSLTTSVECGGKSICDAPFNVEHSCDEVYITIKHDVVFFKQDHLQLKHTGFNAMTVANGEN